MVEEKPNRRWWINFIAGGIVVASWIILFVWKRSNPDLSLKGPLIIVGIVSVIGIITIFGKSIYQRVGKEEEIPRTISETELWDIVKKEVEGMWNHIRINDIGWKRSKEIKGNLIYLFKVNLLYYEDYGHYGDHSSVLFIINANYPESGVTILPPTVSEMHIEKSMNYKSKTPFEEPDTKETETRFDEFQRPIQKVKETRHKKKEKEGEESVV